MQLMFYLFYRKLSQLLFEVDGYVREKNTYATPSRLLNSLQFIHNSLSCRLRIKCEMK